MAEDFGFKDGGVGAPTQDGAFDFFQAAQDHPQARAATWQLDEFLFRMPAASTNEVRAKGVELDDNFVVVFAFHHADAAAQVFGRVEFFRRVEPFAGELGPGEPTQGERADAVAYKVEGEQIPAVIETDDVIRMRAPGEDGFLAAVPVIEHEDPPLGQGAGNEPERPRVARLRGEWAERQGVAERAEAVESAVVEEADEFLARGPQRFLERGAAVLSNAFVRDQHGGNVGLAQWRFGEAGDGFGVVKAVLVRVVLDGQPAFGFQKLQVASDGAFGDAETAGHGAGVRVTAGAKPVVDLGEPLPGGAAVEAGLWLIVDSC